MVVGALGIVRGGRRVEARCQDRTRAPVVGPGRANEPLDTMELNPIERRRKRTDADVVATCREEAGR